jgi:hypothetical protein
VVKSIFIDDILPMCFGTGAAHDKQAQDALQEAFGVLVNI